MHIPQAALDTPLWLVVVALIFEYTVAQYAHSWPLLATSADKFQCVRCYWMKWLAKCRARTKQRRIAQTGGRDTIPNLNLNLNIYYLAKHLAKTKTVSEKCAIKQWIVFKSLNKYKILTAKASHRGRINNWNRFCAPIRDSRAYAAG